jgi:hypothetical protein
MLNEDNFSVNFSDCLEENISKFNTNNTKSTTYQNEKINQNRIIIQDVFGNKNPSVTEIKKLKTEKMVRLAKYLDFNLPSPIQKQDVKEAKEHCMKNIWRLQGLWDDIEVAISIALRAFSARIGKYKKLMKTLIRIVNEIYGVWSIRFKMNFVLNGLLNFTKHFCNDHGCCSRYIWWTQCYNAHLNEYLPTQDYINDISSGRGVRCNTYVPIFFEIFVSLLLSVHIWKDCYHSAFCIRRPQSANLIFIGLELWFLSGKL